MSARSQRRALFIGVGALLILIGLVNILDNPGEIKVDVNALFIIGGIAMIFFNTRK